MTKWAPHFKRRQTNKRREFTARDFDLFYGLYKYELLTTNQLVTIHPGGRDKTVKRLRELYDFKFVERFNTKTDLRESGSHQHVYAFTDAGADWFAMHRPDIDRKKRRYDENNARRDVLMFPHALMISEVMVRYESGCYFQPEDVELIVQHRLTERMPDLTRNRRQPTHWSNKITIERKEYRIGNNPDQFFGLVNKRRQEPKNKMYLFLEGDRGRETVKPITKHFDKTTIFKKMLGYTYTHAHKEHQRVFGEWMGNFRVLWIVDSHGKASSGKTRLQNFIDTAQAAFNAIDGVQRRNLFLFTTYDNFRAAQNPLDVVWFNALGEKTALLS